MKSKEDYLLEYMRMIGVDEDIIAHPNSEDIEHRKQSLDFFALIQLDAYKQGMTDAAEIASDEFLKRSAAVVPTNEARAPLALEVNNAILTARDNKKAL